MEHRVKIAALEALINRVKQQQPSTGHALALSADLSVLAGVYGAMIYWQVTNTDALPLTDEQRHLLARFDQSGSID
jgi:hypothetical protein